MKQPVLVLVSGPPAAGKTTLSRRLAEEFHLPLVAKDTIKETLFDTLGVSDLAWTRELGRAGIALLWQFVETLLQTGNSVIAESNFHAALDSQRLAALQDRYRFTPWQLHCSAPASVLWTRAVERERSGARHPGHRAILPSSDQERERHRQEIEASLAQGVWEPVQIRGRTLRVDTTDWSLPDWTTVSQDLRSVLTGTGPQVVPL